MKLIHNETQEVIHADIRGLCSATRRYLTTEGNCPNCVLMVEVGNGLLSWSHETSECWSMHPDIDTLGCLQYQATQAELLDWVLEHGYEVYKPLPRRKKAVNVAIEVREELP
jgi:hypothetical protein